MNLKRFLGGPWVWVVTFGLGLWIVFGLLQGASAPEEISYSRFVEIATSGQLEGQDLEAVRIGLQSNYIEGEFEGGDGEVVRFTTNYSPEINDDQLAQLIEDDRIQAVEFDPETSSTLVTLLINLLPFALVFLLFFFLMQQMQGGGRIMQFGKSKAKLVNKDSPEVTFDDVAGADEAVEEIREIEEFLERPEQFRDIGAKIPKGVLLYGPPGTGKTLLARAVAGEAGVPFFSISGSDFVEMFVGVGASRVRDLFEQAKENAPAIIFVDEIDAVGRHRGAGMGGGHDEREQTLNQLLVEMDGFDQRTAVILIAATNRPDILDPALLRPGRFDRQIVIDRPDLVGREAILEIHAKDKPLGDDVDFNVLARQTPGFTGADLANLINEAALLAARFGKQQITMEELQESIERVIAGPERRTRLMGEREQQIVAYHEAGHAIVGHALPNADPVHKISIIPRGRALGFTMQLPTEDRYLVARGELIDRLAVMLGGRVAEEIKIGDITGGACDDIEKVTRTAREMVTQYGMSEELGPMTFGQRDSQPFLGRDFGHEPDYSSRIAYRIDREVRRFVDEAHDEALEILVDNAEVLESVAEALLEEETIEGERMEELFAPINKRPSRAVRAPEGQSSEEVLSALRRIHPDDGAGPGGNGRARAPERDRHPGPPGQR